MKLVFPVLALFAGEVALGQLRPAQTRPDLDDLYTRVSESVYVIKGRVVGGKGAGSRVVPLSKEDVEKTMKGISVRTSVEPGGFLFTVAVDQTVCRQSDFAAGAAQIEAPTGLLHIFVPSGEPPVQSVLDSRRHFLSEFLQPGREYLLFLRMDPGKERLFSRYQLDPNLTYYRTYEGDRGAVALPDAGHPEGPYSFIAPLASAVTAFCDAAKAPDVETKIRQLNAVRNHSADSAWRQSVDAAINALQKAQTQALEPR
jgi:hypothetical protein